MLSKVSFMVERKTRKRKKPIKTTGLTAGKAASEQIPVEAAAGGTASGAEPGSSRSTGHGLCRQAGRCPRARGSERPALRGALQRQGE